jgi:hypothetical protein
MITIKNYSEIVGNYISTDGHRIVGVDELPTQYSIIIYDNVNPRFTICLERIGINGMYELWTRGAPPYRKNGRRGIERGFIPKEDIQNKWILMEHMDELLKK